MIKLRHSFSLTQSIFMVVFLVLVGAQGTGIVVEAIDERNEIEETAERQAVAALDMLQSIHTQVMRERRANDDSALQTLKGAMELFSNQSNGTRLWVFMGPKLLDYQNSIGASEIAPPLDDIDEKVSRTSKMHKVVEGNTFRYTRPIILGRGSASDQSCAECHTKLMNIMPGELIGGYSVATDISENILGWQQSIFKRVLGTLITLILMLAVIAFLIKRFALQPLSRLTTSMRLLVAGTTDVEVGFEKRRDEIGALADALRYFRTTLISSRRLEAANADAERQLAYLASHDKLTGLATRSLFVERVAAALRSEERGDKEVVLACIDIDGFKKWNDTLGHTGGDAIIEQLAERVRRLAGENGAAARLDGDEFALLQMKDAGISPQAHGDALMTQLKRPFLINGMEIKLNISVGISIEQLADTDEEMLLKQADVALRQSKAEGLSSYKFFCQDMNAAVEASRQIEADLHEAFRKGQFELHYQPLVSSKSRKIIGVEALMRWHHPARGWIGPAQFIPIAEATRLIVPLGKWLMETACQQAMNWHGLTLAINVSPAQFKDPDFVPFVRDLLARTGFDPSRLELEITEGLLLDNSCKPLESLNALKSLGVKIAMDDFGTGFSSLTYLQKFPFDKIKIDRSFISSLESDRNSLAIVRSVLGLGHSLGIITTAEGVENREQLEILCAEGCDQMQGYLFSKPLEHLKLTSLLMTWEETPAASPPPKKVKAKRPRLATTTQL
ncbi:EAL domain-containing protein [Oryzifoliimicrobium ureilyticus]|uniref:EAL domain-containing protein n=1 Tax=Oryzifoliimicrobium ureilyticus TaxID=3113724 RepID=UPI00307641B8